ncbi:MULTISPECIES: hypothetical protein [Streptomyces]|uniref:hypothetical protein n=1 Tax=Streptomyces TaxID=1883 RepID=UPI001876DA17|nr:hypothetical protein [Streptomyces viridodiastaticus]MCX4625046.1 hypothetical protein [Streptomyces viridodiastaticus]GGQ88599.1 hypothetical protein GCM10010250_69410 [Streptomyces althioticus]
MPKRTRRAARATASRKKRTRTQHKSTTVPQHPQTRGSWRPSRRRSKRRNANRRDILTRYLLRGAAYSTGSGIIGLLFWSLRLWMT